MHKRLSGSPSRDVQTRETSHPQIQELCLRTWQNPSKLESETLAGSVNNSHQLKYTDELVFRLEGVRHILSTCISKYCIEVDLTGLSINSKCT